VLGWQDVATAHQVIEKFRVQGGSGH